MKLNFVYVFLLLGFSFFSCNKEENQKPVTSSEAIAKENLSEIRNKSAFQEQSVIFSSLTSEEKVGVWRLHLEEKMQHPDLNPAQRDFIQATLDEYLKPELYEMGDAIEKDPEFLKFEARQKVLFSEELRFRIFNDLGDILPGIAGGGGGASATACECNIRQDWCWFGETGRNRSKCRAKICTTGGNCGTMLLKRCTGLCTIMPN